MLDANKILEKVRADFELAVKEYAKQNTAVFNQPLQWDQGFGTTRRLNGEIVSGSFRNIVDLGDLRDSQKLTKLSPDAFSLTWTSDYAKYVYFGFITSAGNFVPGRPWASVAETNTDWGKFFKS